LEAKKQELVNQIYFEHVQKNATNCKQLRSVRRSSWQASGIVGRDTNPVEVDHAGVLYSGFSKYLSNLSPSAGLNLTSLLAQLWRSAVFIFIQKIEVNL
jgi:hypothetical protein